MNSGKILILGDLALIGNGSAPLYAGEADWYTQQLNPHWNTADYRIVNLECPAIASPSPVAKNGPCLGLKTDTLSALSGFSLVALANNHIMDHGEAGLRHTRNLLKQARVSTLGAGENLAEAGQPVITEINGVKVGVLAWSHHEFGIAGESTPGAFPIDVVKGLTILEKVREACDYVILLYHGGVEHFPFPTYEQRDLCHFLAKRGADLIVCQHSHVIGASEKVNGSLIHYGQGNYCFDLAGKRNTPSWREALMLEVELGKRKPARVNFIPIVQDIENGMRPRLGNEEESKRILHHQETISTKLADDEEYHSICEKYAQEVARNFIYQQLPTGRYIRKLLKVLKVLESKANQKNVLRLLNKIECEAHADIIKCGLKQIASRH